MKISNMAWSNFKGNIYRYIMYYLSNSFAVASFFIFTNFLFHPSIDFRNLGGHYLAASGAVMAIIICIIVIVGFSILFVAYANSLFIKSRGKEIGLLSLYGMTKKQIRKYIFIENTIISLLSILTGIGMGLVFSKLFLMAMESFIAVNLALNISIKALLLTGGLFIIIFESINFISLYLIRDKQIVEQIKSQKKAKELASFSKVKAIFGLVLLISSYIAAWKVKGAMVVLGMIPITMTTIIGTYFTITEFSLYAFTRLNENKKIKYKGTNIVALSQLMFKLKDTVKVLFLASILGAITFTATETIFTFYRDVDRITGHDGNEDIILGNFESQADYDEISKDIVERIDKGDGEIKSSYDLEFIRGTNMNYEENNRTSEKIAIISQSNYNRVSRLYDGEELALDGNDSIYIYSNVIYDFDGKKKVEELIPEKKIEISLDGVAEEFKLLEQLPESVLGIHRLGVGDTLIISDSSYEKLEEELDREKIRMVKGINVVDQEKAYKDSREVWQELAVDGDFHKELYFKILPNVETRKNFGMILFIGFFISFLFFIASGSIIYFKLFNEIRQDQEEYEILRKIGLRDGELNRIITGQIGLIFFIPFLVSSSHSLFALKSLSNLVGLKLLSNGIIVLLGYLFFQIIYFVFIRKAYIKKIGII